MASIDQLERNLFHQMSSLAQPTRVAPPNAGPLAHYNPAVSAFIQSNATLLVTLVRAHRADAARRANSHFNTLMGHYEELRREYIKLKEERDELLVEVEKGKTREEALRCVIGNVNGSLVYNPSCAFIYTYTWLRQRQHCNLRTRGRYH